MHTKILKTGAFGLVEHCALGEQAFTSYIRVGRALVFDAVSTKKANDLNFILPPFQDVPQSIQIVPSNRTATGFTPLENLLSLAF